MKTIIPALVGAFGLCAAFVACEDGTSTIGSSLADQNVRIVVDSSFTVTGKTVFVARIRPKTTQQLIGRIDIPAYGSLESSTVMQFLPSTSLDTAEFTAANVDSVLLTLRYARGAFLGDSMAPMQLTVYPLLKDKILPDTMSSAFDPDTYYNHTPLASCVYTASTFDATDEDKAATYRDINVRLDRNNNLGKELFAAFEKNPASYANGQIFSRDVFPGLYVRTTYGNGRMTRAALTTMTLFMRKIYVPKDSVKPDTIAGIHTYYMVTPEVLSNNTLHYTMAEPLKQLIAQGHNVVVAPAATELEFTFPLPEVIAAYRNNNNGVSVVNSLSLFLPADSIENGFGVTPPPYMLMVLKKDRDEFFAKNKLTDNITSFYASYSATDGGYSFASLQAYLNEMVEKESITADDYTFSLVPIQVSFENLVSSGYYSTSSQQTESEILPYLLQPAMADFRLNDAKIKFSYSLQTRN